MLRIARQMAMNHWRQGLHRTAYISLISNAVNAASSFVFWWLTARLLAPNLLGTATSTAAILTTATMVVKLGLDAVALRTIPNLDAIRVSRFFFRSLTIMLLISLVAGFATTLLLFRIWNQFGLTLFVGSALAMLSWASSMVLDNVFLAQGKPWLVLARTAVNAILKLVLVFPAVWYFGPIGALLALFSPFIVTNFVSARSLYRKQVLSKADQNTHALTTIRTVLVEYWISILMSLPTAFGSMVILYRFGKEAAGEFYLLWMLGSLALLVPLAFGQAGTIEIKRTGESNVMRRPGTILASVGGSLLVLVLASFFFMTLPHSTSISGFFGILPFALSGIPGYVFHGRLAELRASNGNKALIISTSALVISFSLGLILMIEVATVGWFWLSALMIASAFTFWPAHKIIDEKHQG